MISSPLNNQVRFIRRDPYPQDHLPADLHPILKRVYAARDVISPGELERDLGALLDVNLLGGAKEAASLISDHIAEQSRILIIGDFDADGATSTTLGILALRAMGAADVDYLVPNRFEFGYGLTPEILAIAAARKPSLIITVDNGISSVEGVKAANEAGIPVIVTDHHLPGPQIPAAAAIVNPNVPDNTFPGKASAGVGVIFYVMLAVRAELRARGWFDQQGMSEPNMADYLDLVALGTVADLVPLDRNNRILVYQGIQRIRAGRGREGINALLALGKRQLPEIKASDMGFVVGPRLNAAGRLEDMSLGIECLLAESPGIAMSKALELDELNQSRRQIEDEMKEQAVRLVDNLVMDDEDALPWGLCLFDESWHQGVIGILASRIKARLHRPVIAFAPAGDDQVKGSARSIPGFHIRDALDQVAAENPGLLDRFGGHAMAAGMSLQSSNLDAFSKAFDKVAREHLSEDDLEYCLYTDGEIRGDEISIDIARLIQEGGPWGQGFPEPVFDGEFRVIQQRIVGERHWKLVLQPKECQSMVDAIGFGLVESHPAPLPDRMHIAYKMNENIYRGERNLQLVIEQMSPL